MRQNYSPDGATAAYLIVTCYNFELEDFFGMVSPENI